MGRIVAHVTIENTSDPENRIECDSLEDGKYEPLVGYIVLEQCQAAVDKLGHRLVHVKRLDLK